MRARSTAKWPSRALLTLSLLAIIVLALSRSAAASSVSQYSIWQYNSATPPGLGGIVRGPDGALWFAESGTSKIGRITTAGTVTDFPVTAVNPGPADIAAGPDGRLWFTEGDQIGAITTTGAATDYPVPVVQCNDCSGPTAISPGPDGRLWFTLPGQNVIGAVATDGTVSEYPIVGVPAGTSLLLPAIAAGPDGRLWFTVGSTIGSGPGVNAIGAITTAGASSLYGLPSGSTPFPGAIAAGPDGRLWFGDAAIQGIGAIATNGTVQAYTLLEPCPAVGRCLRQRPLFGPPKAIVSGPDGRVWFTDGSTYAAITSGGALAQFTPPSHGNVTGLAGMAAGPDGRIWMTDLVTAGEGGAEIADLILAATTTGGPVAGVSHPGCVVPTLVGRKLAAARRALSMGHCGLGRVRRVKRAGKRGRVLSQSARPGSAHPAGFPVGITVGR